MHLSDLAHVLLFALTCTLGKSLTGKEKQRINSDKNNFQDKFLLVQNTNLLRYRSTNLSKNAEHSLHTPCSSSQAIYKCKKSKIYRFMKLFGHEHNFLLKTKPHYLYKSISF